MDTVRYASANKWVKLQCPVYSSLHFALSTATRAKNRSVWKRCRACRPSQFGKCTLQNKFNVIMKLMKKAGDELICGLDISLHRCEYIHRAYKAAYLRRNNIRFVTTLTHRVWLALMTSSMTVYQTRRHMSRDLVAVYASGVTEMTSHLRPEVVIGSWREGGRTLDNNRCITLFIRVCVCVCDNRLWWRHAECSCSAWSIMLCCCF